MWMSPFQPIISHVMSNNRKDASWEVNTLPTVCLRDGPLGVHVLLSLTLMSDCVDISERSCLYISPDV